MFGNGTYTQSKSNQTNVNTKLVTLYSDDSMVSVGAWNTNLSIKFHPATGKNADGITQYSQDNNYIVTLVVTPDNARALLDGINNQIIPAINAKGTNSVAIRTGSGENMKILCVGCENGAPYMYVAKNLMNDITGNDNIIMHHFSTRSYLLGYTHTNGSSAEVTVYTGFLNFVKRLEGVDRLVPDVQHSINYATAVRSAIASSYNNNSYNNNNVQPKYEAVVSNFEGSSSGEFLPFA